MRLAIPFAFVTLAVVAPIRVKAQDAPGSAPAEHGVRFFQAAGANPVLVDIRRQPVLAHRISVHLDGASLGDALAEISRRAGVSLMYSKETLPLDHRVYLSAEHITVAGALSEVLFDLGVDIVLSSGNQVVVVKRPVGARLIQDSTGTIVGSVTDAKTHEPIVGVTVQLDGTRLGTVTGTDGTYRIVNVQPGTYMISARRIGYKKVSHPVTVSWGQRVTLNLALENTVNTLDQVVVTGTLVPTEVKAMPTPINVINANDIAQQRPHTVQELFRQVVPGGVSWDLAASPFQTPFSARGASTLSPGAGQMKLIIDGVPTAFPSYASVDPSSIARVEVIRGPEAAAIYGSDAIGGVIQVFTKRGDPTLSRPEVRAELSLGAVETPYSGFGHVLRQKYSTSLRGAAANASYEVGAGYTRLGDYIPDGEQSAQSNPSLYGGLRFTRSGVVVDLSGRYYQQNYPNVNNPDLFEAGYPPYSRPEYQPTEVVNQTIGAQISVKTRDWWHHSLVLGVDRASFTTAQSRPRLTTANDTLLAVSNQNRDKRSVSFHTSIQGALGPEMSGSLTVGLDYYTLPVSSFSTSSALNTTGGIRLVPGGAVFLSRSVTTNSGYYAQGQLGFRGALFITAAVRGEHNSDFGDSLGTPLSPQLGASYVRDFGSATLKVRTSYGRAIRAPSPGLKLGTVSAARVILANPQLGPERQRGWDAGLDLEFGSAGGLSVTYYDQTADNLIESVLIQATPVSTVQNQNVGRVQNSGVEVEGAFTVGAVQLKAQYAYARSRIRDLGPTYAGDLRVGEQPLGVPKHTAGGVVTLGPTPATRLAVGVSYVGSWRSYDLLAYYRCLGHTGPCASGVPLRSYIVSYPSFLKLNLSLSQDLMRNASAFVSVDNLTNNTTHELVNLAPVLGRAVMAGLQFRY